MTDLTLRDDLVQRLQQIANQEHRRVDDIVETLLNHYDPIKSGDLVLEGDLHQDRLHIYDRARAYWQRMDDSRQHLSNEDLEQRFWLIDPNGIPRLKDEQSTVKLPVDPLVQILEMAEAERTIQWRVTNDFEGAKDILNREYTNHLLTRLNNAGALDK